MTTSLDRTAALFVSLAGVLLAAAAGLGAIGAHVLRDTLPATAYQSYELAVTYQFHHSLGLLAAAWLVERCDSRWAVGAGVAFLTGIAAFCGSIYARSFGAPLPVPVAPYGGMAFMAGWLALAAAGVAAFPGRSRQAGPGPGGTSRA